MMTDWSDDLYQVCCSIRNISVITIKSFFAIDFGGSIPASYGLGIDKTKKALRYRRAFLFSGVEASGAAKIENYCF